MTKSITHESLTGSYIIVFYVKTKLKSEGDKRGGVQLPVNDTAQGFVQ